MAQNDSPIENEIKLRIPDVATAMHLLESHGFSLSRAREFESNEVFDTNDGALFARGELIRLRTCAGVALLTFKAPSLPGPHKRREELETRVEDAEALRRILGRIGFQVSFRYEKYRSEFRRGADVGVVTIDETPIGTFLELEGEPGWVDEVARELGFSTEDYILSSYGRLYLDHCTAHNHKPGHMVFSR